MELDELNISSNEENIAEEEVVVEKETDSSSKPVDRFSQLMFGSRSVSQNPEQEQIQPKPSEKQQEINYFTLMEQIDDIMLSVENLKPMLKQFAPLLDYIKKK
ncbi:hypothetical protein FS935_12705 [Metabacillus litoralis]|uniref:Uncharacterized protein n=1 Tax=Metabacillus litoralis TaxID=152268 RepID=A0A5C6W4K3_9BACI|nr:hypothetical protein [Metabacillus litoralis]TXC90763.1 hypothetical protein FS935_12705 [Metabacillus litoralis]